MKLFLDWNKEGFNELNQELIEMKQEERANCGQKKSSTQKIGFGIIDVTIFGVGHLDESEYNIYV